MVFAMHKHVRLRKFDRLDQRFDLYERALSRPEHQMKMKEAGDFVETCLKEDVDVPISCRHRLASFLGKLCTQYDRILDDELFFLDQDDLLSEADRSIRGQALGNLINFGYWVRRQLADDQVDSPEVFSILSKRLSPQCAHPMTLPEYAMLGSHYNLLFSWNQEWATRHKNGIFPQKDPRAWTVAFSHYLNRNESYKPVFDIVRDDIMFALNHIDWFNTKGFGEEEDDPVDSLGQHLIGYFFLGIYPLTGKDSLLEIFYDKTDENRWARLFSYTGFFLQRIGKKLDDKLERRIVEFAGWCLKRRNPSELKEFAPWREAECLDEKWRLNFCSEVLDIYQLLGIQMRPLLYRVIQKRNAIE